MGRLPRRLAGAFSAGGYGRLLHLTELFDKVRSAGARLLWLHTYGERFVPEGGRTELLELLWVLEATVANYPEQAELLEAVVTGECFEANELPEAPERMRKPPKTGAQDGGMFDWDDDT